MHEVGFGPDLFLGRVLSSHKSFQKKIPRILLRNFA